MLEIEPELIRNGYSMFNALYCGFSNVARKFGLQENIAN